ncbi:MAG: hypothetical protein ACOC93_05840, partial [Planctomycetota bacterium]
MAKMNFATNKKQYRLRLGENWNGKRQNFWLGPDEQQARHLTAALEDMWQYRCEHDEPWQPKDIDCFKQMKAAAYDYNREHAAVHWQPDTRYATTVQFSFYHWSNAELEADERDRQRRAAGEHVPPRDHTSLSEAVKAWQQIVQQSSRSAEQIRTLVYRIEHVGLPDVPVASFTYDRVMQVIDEQVKLAKGGQIAA